MASKEFMKNEHDKFVSDLICSGISAQEAEMHWNFAVDMLEKLVLKSQTAKKNGERG